MISLKFDPISTSVSNFSRNTCARVNLDASVADAELKGHAQGSAVVVYN